MTQPGTLPVLPSPRLPKETLLAMVRLASGVQCYWGSRKQDHYGQKPSTEHAWVFVRVSAISTVAIDERRLTWNPNTQQNDVLVVAHRSFTLNLKAQSLDDKLEAYDLLERVRVRFRTQRIRALMVPTIALEKMTNITNTNVFADNREMPQASLDIRLRCVLSFDNLDEAEGQWIETVSGLDDGGTLTP